MEYRGYTIETDKPEYIGRMRLRPEVERRFRRVYYWQCTQGWLRNQRTISSSPLPSTHENLKRNAVYALWRKAVTACKKMRPCRFLHRSAPDRCDGTQLQSQRMHQSRSMGSLQRTRCKALPQWMRQHCQTRMCLSQAWWGAKSIMTSWFHQ